MSQTVNETGFGVIKVPGSYVQTKVIDNQAGALSTGVIALIGEADAGPDFTQETTLPSFGPDELSAVQAKYGSGPIVDAFFRATVASNDPLITNTFTRAIIVKTNVSTKASTSLTRAGLSNYSVIGSKNYGALENQIAVQVVSVAEVAPTTGLFTYVPAHQQVILSMRANGGAKTNVTIAANTGPDSIPALVNAANSDVLCTGGVNRAVIGAGSIGATISLVASGLSATISLSTGSWAVTPQVGDTLVIPNNLDYGIAVSPSSVLMVAAAANRGTYVVTAATSNSVTATKVRDYGAATISSPVNKSAAILDVDEIVVYSPLKVDIVKGVDRSVLTTGLVSVNIAAAVSGSTMTLTLGTGSVWSALPQAGDLLFVPASGPLSTNAGWYSVTSATTGTAAGASTITSTRLSNGSPSAVGATALTAITNFQVYKPAIDGVGKSLELYDGGGTETLATTPLKFMALSPNANVSWISTAVSPVLLTSATQTSTTLSASRSSTSSSESVTAGGDVIVRVGYKGNGLATTGSLTISGTTLTTTVVGGNGSNLSIDLKQFGTIGDLVSFINAQPGYVASASSNAVASRPLIYTLSDGTKATVLDKATWGIASELGSAAGRIKNDGYSLWSVVNSDMNLIQLGTSATLASVPSAGLPETQALTFLTSGAKGATTNSTVQAGLVALERVTANFVVPLFSRDATTDIAQGLTEATSTYTISQIHDLVKTHVLLMSQVKRRKWRQAFLSFKGSFTQARAAAATVASAKASVCFQDIIATSAAGDSVQFQPWMAAVLAASMQAGGFNEPIVKKVVNVSGVLMADGSYGDSIGEQESALDAGLLPLELATGIGIRWVSDQTTYAADNNFVYNSVQAVYMVDALAALISSRMERKFVGRPLSQVPAAVMRAYLESVMREALALGITAPSDGAEQGFKDASIEIRAPAAYVKVTASLDSGLYFVLTTAFVTKVTSAA